MVVATISIQNCGVGGGAPEGRSYWQVGKVRAREAQDRGEEVPRKKGVQAYAHGSVWH